VYDVFISYAHADRRHAADINSVLVEDDLRPCYDRRSLAAGLPWVRALEQAIGEVNAVIVLIGPHGLGNTQQYERELALVRQSRDPAFPVVPVILPETTTDRPFDFLQVLTWVDFSHVKRVSEAPDQLTQLLAAIRARPTAGDVAQVAICPYRGLDAFREEDSAFFFGRGNADDPTSPIGELVRKVREHPFVMVVGRSGSGKSSLIHAGLLPVLRRERDRFWSVLSVRPGPTPLRALAAAFNPRAENEGSAAYMAKITEEANKLRSCDPSLLSHMIVQELEQAEGQPDRLLLYIDQWEELYAQASSRREADGSDLRGTDVNRFVDLLVNAAYSAPLTVVATVRADFYDPLIGHPEIRSLLPAQQVLLGSMPRSELEQTIVEPAKKVGLAFDPPTLVQRILDEAGEDEGMLPLLQYALKETWALREGNAMTAESYARSGGVNEAIRITAERTFKALSYDDQQAARLLFLRLVTPGEGAEDTRARATMPAELDQRKVVELFAGPRTRLLVTGWDRAAHPTVEVAHEALIRRWPRLREWIDANREKLRSRASIRQAQADWEGNAGPDDLLLSSGIALARARALLTDPGDITIDDLQEFVSLSVVREQKRIDADKAKELELARIAADTERMRADLERQRAEGAEHRAASAQANARAARWTLGATIVAALGLVLLFLYNRAETARALALDFQSRLIASIANSYLSPSVTSGAADALAIALAKEKNVPDVTAYVQVLYRGLGDLREKRRIKLPAQVFSVNFAPMKHLLLAVASSTSEVQFFQSDSGEFVDSMPFSGHGFFTARWSPDGERIYVGMNPVAMVVTPCSREKLRHYFQICNGKTTDIIVQIGSTEEPAGPGVWSPDARRILTGGFHASAKLWDASSGMLEPSFADVLPLGQRDRPATSVAFSSDGRRMAIGALSGEIHIVDAKSMKLLKSLKPSRPDSRGSIPFSIAFDPTDSNLLLATYPTPIAQLWDIDRGESRALNHGPANAMQRTFDPRGQFIVTASNDGVVRLWKPIIEPNLKPIQLQGHLGPAFSVDVDTDGTIASSAADRTIRLWSEDAPLSPKQQSDASDLIFTPSTIRVEQSTVFKNGEPLHARLPRDFGDIADAAVSAQGHGIVIAPRHGYPLLFLRDNDTPIAALTGPNVEWKSVAFIEKDSRIAAKTSDGTVYTWPFIFDVHTLEHMAAENLPFQGSKRITPYFAIRCRLIEKISEDCEPALMYIAHPQSPPIAEE
jgi:WD40 repeat protein